METCNVVAWRSELALTTSMEIHSGATSYLSHPRHCRAAIFLGLDSSRRNSSNLPRKFKRSLEVKRAVALADFKERYTSECQSSPGLDSPSMDFREGGIAEVVGNARRLDYSLESFEEGNRSGRSGGSSSLKWETDERLRRSCETGTNLRVAVLVSGGVDSSVALRLLCNAGHSCTAFYLKIWFQEDFENFWSSCPWEEDLSFAQDVCDEAGVELKVVHLTDAYWGKVVADSILEIQAGRTPNPDMLCNSRIKFGEFFEHIKHDEFDRVASGHYAHVEREDKDGKQVTRLHLSADETKDQTYFLSQLSQTQLTRLMFPLGGLSKVEVREVAMAMGLSNKLRKDSQGICFLGKVKFREFIGRHLGEKEGCLLEAETGEILGTHKGFWFYTIGQRQGIGLSNGPWFVVAKDVEHNAVFISRKYYNEKKRRSFRVGSFNWVSGSPPLTMADMLCKVRHGPQFYRCKIQFDLPDVSEANRTVETAIVNLAEDDQGLAPGQYAAFYHGDMCLGSGIILEALGVDTEMNVSLQALEMAKVCNASDFVKNQIALKKKPCTARIMGDKDVLESVQEDCSSMLKMTGLEVVNGSSGIESTGLPGKEKAIGGPHRGIWSLTLQYISRIFMWCI